MAKLVLLSATISMFLPTTWSFSVTSNLPIKKHHQVILDEPIQSQRHSAAMLQVRPDTQPPEPIKYQLPRIRKYRGDPEKTIRVRINDLRHRYVRLENMIDVLERISYAISKPVAIIDAIRLFALTISSVLMATLNVS